MAYAACRFEVFGRVQRVYFRKYTQQRAQQLGLVGWVMNTPQGTVVGEVQGPSQRVKDMQQWLTHEGSPMSHVERADFSDERDIDSLEFSSFDVRR